MSKTGMLGEYFWVQAETDRLGVPDLVRGLAENLRGLIAVNVSWDSGEMPLTQSQEAEGWYRDSGHAVSPPIEDAMLQHWPSSLCLSGRFDEWYFFRSEPSTDLVAYCNHVLSLEKSSELTREFSGVTNLQVQLTRTGPVLVIGDGFLPFAIAQDRQLASAVAALFG